MDRCAIGQFDTMNVAERKAVASAWVSAGKATGLFTIIQCGETVISDAAEIAGETKIERV